MRFFGKDVVTNLKAFIVAANDDETEFLDSHLKSDVIDMLRIHTYTISKHGSMCGSKKHYHKNSKDNANMSLFNVEGMCNALVHG